MPEKYYAEIFAQNGASYHRAMQKWPTARDEEFEMTLSFLNLIGDEHILDVPAGGGYLENYLPKDCKYTGLDFSGGFGSEHNQVSKCAETQFELADSCIDAVVSLAALHHIEQRRGFYREVHRVLKPGKPFLIADIVVGSRADRFLNTFVNSWTKLGHQGNFIDPERDTNHLKESGFSAEYSSRSYHWNFNSKEAATDYFRLLFTLDLNPSVKILDKEISNLGACDTGQSFQVDWSLGFIKAIAL